MEASEDGDLNEVAMPGFVDILSSVITVFMFFMLITSAVMFFLSLQIKKNAVEEIKKAQEEASKKASDAKSETTEEIQKLLEQVKKGDITIEQMSQAITSMSMSSTKGGTAEAKKAGGSSDTSESSNSDAQNQSATRGQITMKDDSQQSMARFSKSEDNTQTTIIDPTSNDLIILFGHGDVTVTDKTTQTIETYLKNARDKKDGALSLILESSNDPNASSASLSREAELGRTLNVRNTLLGKNILPQAITVQNVEATKESDTYDWVKIHVEK